MAERKHILKKLEGLGHWFFYVALRLFGLKGGNLLLIPVVFCYIVFSRKIHAAVRPYLRLRFPEETAVKYFFHTFANVYSFGRVLVERGWLGTCDGATLQGDFAGYEQLQQEIEKGNGLVLLTAHMGNWQSALAHLENLPAPVNALMQYDQEAVAKHYFDLRGSAKPFNIIDVNGEFGGMVDAVAALNRGEIVTIMGDRFVKGSASEVTLLGRKTRLPDSAYILAASAKAPVAIVFAAQLEPGGYQFKVWDLFYPEYDSREQRAEMRSSSCSRFGRSVEKYLQLYPYQWYNFFDFWKQ